MAQMGSRETEESASTQPRAVAQAGATRPFPSFRGDQLIREKRKVPCGGRERERGENQGLVLQRKPVSELARKRGNQPNY